MIEDQEREKRCNFIIFHGLAEKGTNTEEINNDVDLVELFFQQINNEARPTKLANNVDRDAVMKNLNYLKGSEKELGKLSVNKDVIQNERKLVRKFVDMLRKEMRVTHPIAWSFVEHQKTDYA